MGGSIFGDPNTWLNMRNTTEPDEHACRALAAQCFVVGDHAGSLRWDEEALRKRKQAADQAARPPSNEQA